MPGLPAMFAESDFEIQPAVYEWTAKTLALLERVLRVRIRLHGEPSLLESGEIFLFNHFARFETFIPQYLIYRHTGAYCRSVAGGEFFRGAEALSRYLRSLGAVPNDWPGLLPFLAAEVLRGRKVVVFPEGGMVKDRRVLDEAGRYRVYSRTARERRKHHTGAAVVGLAVEGFKRAVRQAAERGEQGRLERWADALGLDGAEQLVERAGRPTRIVPANITFYPIRISENFLQKGAELFHRGLSPRMSEELLIEGNLLFRDSDMDIRLADPLDVEEFLPWWDRWIVLRLAEKITVPGDLVRAAWPGWAARVWRHRARRQAMRIRDGYMVAMYAAATVNLSHLASRVVFGFLDRGLAEVPAARFHRTVYLSVKRAQARPGLHLHPSVLEPARYRGLLDDGCPGLEQLVDTARRAGLLERQRDIYRFSEKLRQEHHIDEIRVENPLAVYANEVAPLAGVRKAVERALDEEGRLPGAEWARLRFDDELRDQELELSSIDRSQDPEREEPPKKPSEPFLLLPERPKALAVVLVHGFSASPAEMRPFGERLAGEENYPVVGVRLAGHGTSPLAMERTTWEDWLGSARRGFRIAALLADRVAVVGFSAGGCLALCLAAENPPGLAGVAAVAAPVRVRDRGMRLVPLVHGANVVVGTLGGKGVLRFHRTEPEHPDINYRHVPVEGLYQLGQLIGETQERLEDVRCPVLLIQGSEDPTVDPASAEILYRGLPGKDKALVLIPSDRHGILLEDVGGTQERIIRFLRDLEGEDA